MATTTNTISTTTPHSRVFDISAFQSTRGTRGWERTSNEELASEGTSTPTDETETQTRVLTEAEFAVAYEKGFRRTIRFLRSRGANEDIAEEVAQAAWSRGWERLYQLRTREALEVWIASIAKHLWSGRIVRDQRTQEIDETMSTCGPAETNLLWNEIVSCCEPEERRLLGLHYVSGYNSREIAKELGCSALAVRLRLMRVRRKIDASLPPDLLQRAA